MSAEVAYLDTSAILKLIVTERESDALGQSLASWNAYASSVVTATEVQRTLRRSAHTRQSGRARQLLTGMNLINVDSVLAERAGSLDPAELRSLDALHLSAALTLGVSLGAFYTYDVRLAGHVEATGITVLAPR